MKENEFDQKIRETAFAQESRMEKPLWNKSGTWSRIESGLGQKNQTNWWKIASVVLLFLSFTWSYAQWNDFRKYKIENEAKQNEIQRELQYCVENSASQVSANQIIIGNQKSEIDTLKAKLNRVGKPDRKRILKSQVLAKDMNAENSFRKEDQKNLIDSLRSQLKLALQHNSDNETSSSGNVAKLLTIENPKAQPFVSPENQILYIGNQALPQNIKKEKSFRIGIFGLSREENIEYKSDHSIFKK